MWIGRAFRSIRVAFTNERRFLLMRAFFSGTRLRARKHARGSIQHRLALLEFTLVVAHGLDISASAPASVWAICSVVRAS
jgi:hypothetical protein